MTGAGRSSWWIWTSATLMAAVVLWFFPLFRVVPLTTARQHAVAVAFDPRAFVEGFWNEDLPRVYSQAIEVGELLEGLRQDPVTTAQQHGRRLGLSNVSTYLVAGTGRITQVTDAAVILTVGDPGAEAKVMIETGPVFGNALRDGSGLLDVNDFPHSQDFNAVSAELNRRVEEDLLPGLKSQAAAGARVRFVGCAELADARADARSLLVVPIRIEWL